MTPPATARRRLVGLLALAALAGGLAACGGDEPSVLMTEEEVVVDPFRGVPDRLLPTLVRASRFAPADAPEVAVTDLERIRDRFGMSGLDSTWPAADRRAFWRRARDEAALLAPGVLRRGGGRLLAEHGFGEDDVRWEATIAGPDGLGAGPPAGWVVALRAGVPDRLVREAVAAGTPPLGDAELRDGLLLSGVAREAAAADPADTWRADAVVLGAGKGVPAESTWLQRGCLPLDDQLGAGAAERVRTAYALDHWEQLDAWALSFGDLVATAWLSETEEGRRRDLFERGDLVVDWPGGGSPAVADAWQGEPVEDPTTGRIGLDIGDPAAAASLVRAGVVPFVTCAEPD